METSGISPILPSRGKRKRYTPMACDECKKRKEKCDSQTPCRRCSERAATCSYSSRLGTISLLKDSEIDALNQKCDKMQAQIDRLIADRHQADAGSPSKQRSTIILPPPEDSSTTTVSTDYRQSNHHGPLDLSSRARQPEFLGPTSSSFLLRMATNTLAKAGIHTSTPANPDGLEPEPQQGSAKVRCQDTENPLSIIPREEALRLLKLYDEEYGLIYPFIDMTVLSHAAQYFYDCVDSGSPASTRIYLKDENTLTDGILDILKLALAIAAAVESRGPNELSARLLKSVESCFETRFLGTKVELLEIQAWTAISILQFHLDDEILAWRTIGLAGRAVIELGLHRHETYSTRFVDNKQRLRASQLFWSIYILDRRWSFVTGRSFSIPEYDIDLELSTSSTSDSYLFSTMVAYAQLESRVWKLTTKTAAKVSIEKMSFLYFRVQQWYRGLKPHYQLQPTEVNMLDGHTRSENRIRLFFYFSANQLQLFIFRQELLNSHVMYEDLPNARFAVEAAKDNIRLLQKVSRTPDFYSTQQASFNHFLVSALSVLFLAVCHAPFQFNNACQEEFLVALELIQGFSFESQLGKRLWKRVQHLKEISLSLGLLPNQAHADDAQNNALNSMDPILPTSELMITEQDQNVETYQPPGYLQARSPSVHEKIDPFQLTGDLTTIFDTMQQHYTWSATGEAVLNHNDRYHQAVNREISRDFLDLI